MPPLQALKDRLIARIQATEDPKTLEQVQQVLQQSDELIYPVGASEGIRPEAMDAHLDQKIREAEEGVSLPHKTVVEKARAKVAQLKQSRQG